MTAGRQLIRLAPIGQRKWGRVMAIGMLYRLILGTDRHDRDWWSLLTYDFGF